MRSEWLALGPLQCCFLAVWVLSLLCPCAARAQAVPVAPSSVEHDSPQNAQAPESSVASGAEPVEVVVEGERALLLSSPRAPTAASTVLTGDELDRVGDSSADVLRQVPGVQVFRTGAESERASVNIRGAEGNQVPVYLAGIRLNDDVSGFADLSNLPLWMVQRVEVIRGSAPAGGERLGLGGAVYFEPKRARHNRIGAQLHAGSYGARSGWVGSEVTGAHAGALIALRRNQADNDYPFVNDSGQRFVLDEQSQRRPNADFVSHDAWAVGEVHDDGLRVVGVTNALDREQGVTGVATVPARNARARVRRLLSGVAARVQCSDDASCELGLDVNALVENSTITDELRELRAPRAAWVHNRGERLSQALRGRWDMTEWLSLDAALRHTYDELELARTSGLPHSARRRLVRASSGAHLQFLRRWSAHAFLAANCYATRGRFTRTGRAASTETSDCTADTPDAHLGLGFEVSPSVELLANASMALRLPTLGEQYGTSPVLDGNPELVPERGRSVDAGARWRHSWGGVRWALDGFAFARWADDLVRFRRTSLNAFSAYNVGRARILGLEAALRSDWFGHVSTNTALTLIDPRDTQRSAGVGNDILPLMSRMVVAQSVDVTTDWLKANVRRAALGVRFFYRSNRFVDPAGLETLPSLQLWDLHASWHLQTPDVEFSASVNNLFDVRTLDFIGLPLAGRAMHAAVAVWH